MAHIFFVRIAARMPDLKAKLRSAGMDIKPEEFVKKTFVVSFYVTFGLFFALVLFLAKTSFFSWKMALGFFPVFALLLLYLLKLPDARIISKRKEMDKEIVFAGRFLVIELQSGVPLYNAFANLAKNYPSIGPYCKEIIDKVDLGTSMEDALNEAVELTPSDDFRKILWQIINAMRIGSDLSTALSGTIDQIAKRQQIAMNEYSKKLNPLAMFYMMLAVIAPTLGITMLIILSSFVNLTINLTVLLVIAGLLGFMQFMFLSIIKFSRPPIDL